MENETNKPTTQDSTPQTPTLIEEAKAIAERMEKANAEHKALLDRQEQMTARAILSGRSEAGITPKATDPEEEANKQAMTLLQGTGLNPFKRAGK
jgi:hypothetical protein